MLKMIEACLIGFTSGQIDLIWLCYLISIASGIEQDESTPIVLIFQSSLCLINRKMIFDSPKRWKVSSQFLLCHVLCLCFRSSINVDLDLARSRWIPLFFRSDTIHIYHISSKICCVQMKIWWPDLGLDWFPNFDSRVEEVMINQNEKLPDNCLQFDHRNRITWKLDKIEDWLVCTRFSTNTHRSTDFWEHELNPGLLPEMIDHVSGYDSCLILFAQL